MLSVSSALHPPPVEETSMPVPCNIRNDLLPVVLLLRDDAAMRHSGGVISSKPIQINLCQLCGYYLEVLSHREGIIRFQVISNHRGLLQKGSDEDNKQEA